MSKTVRVLLTLFQTDNFIPDITIRSRRGIMKIFINLN